MREKEKAQYKKGITCWKKTRGSGSSRRRARARARVCVCVCVWEIAGGWGGSTVSRNTCRIN